MKYMLTAARINLAPDRKKHTTPTISDWKLKFGEYEVMANLTVYKIEV